MIEDVAQPWRYTTVNVRPNIRLVVESLNSAGHTWITILFARYFVAGSRLLAEQLPVDILY